MIRYKTNCWNCGYENTAVSAPGEPSNSLPDDGDVSICWQCGELAIFDRTRAEKVRKPWPREKDELLNTKEIVLMIRAWQKARSGLHE